MISDEHDEISRGAEADGRDREITMRVTVRYEVESAMLAGRGQRCRDKSRVGRDHQQTVYEPHAASGVVPAFAEQIPHAGGGVHAEQPHDPGADHTVRALLPAAVAVVNGPPRASWLANSGSVAQLAMR